MLSVPRLGGLHHRHDLAACSELGIPERSKTSDGRGGSRVPVVKPAATLSSSCIATRFLTYHPDGILTNLQESTK